MGQLATLSHRPAPLPPARMGGTSDAGGAPISIRPGTPGDLPFIDALQKQHGKQLGFMNRPTLEGKIKLGHVLVAEEVRGSPFVVRGEQIDRGEQDLPQTSNHEPIAPLGYLIGNDRYRHRDELGVIFQLCVAPEYRRSLVAAHLLKAQFERSAYGCKLYCCWCAQDLAANRFWESMGFVPIAFRAGSEKRGRVHIFWQRRIRAGDTQTPWWFPSETSGGLMDASRIALPIPQGMHWSDELPRLIPTARPEAEGESDPAAALQTRAKSPKRSKREKQQPSPSAPPTPVITGIRSGGLRLSPDVFEPSAPVTPAAEPAPEPAAASIAATMPARPKRVKKADTELAARARELRDRWVEAADRGEWVALPAAKYDIGRQLPDPAHPQPALLSECPTARSMSVPLMPSTQACLPLMGGAPMPQEEIAA